MGGRWRQSLHRRLVYVLDVALLTTSQGICGMSVVPGDYERLKRYNLAELPGLGPDPEHQSEAALVGSPVQDPTTFKRLTEMEADDNTHDDSHRPASAHLSTSHA